MKRKRKRHLTFEQSVFSKILDYIYIQNAGMLPSVAISMRSNDEMSGTAQPSGIS